MSRRILLAAFCLPWFALVYLVTWWLTFPGGAVGERFAAMVAEWSNGRTLLEVDDVGPWWIGLTASKVRVYDVDPRNPDLPSTLRVAADDVRARVGLFGLLTGNRNFTGSATAGETTIDVEATVRMDEARNKGWTLTRLVVGAPGANLEDLSLLYTMPVMGTGKLDVAVDVAGEDGMRTATGSASIVGRNLVLTEVNAPGLEGMELGEIPVDLIDLALEIKDGRARITKGEITSAMVEGEISGDITLRDEIGRSNLRVTAVVELRGEYEKFAAFAGDAKWADGKLHFVCTGYLSSPSCRADRESGRRSSRAGAGATAPIPGAAPTATDADDERARRREEARERVRRRREEREGRAAVPAGEEPTPVEDDPPPVEEEEPEPIEEEPLPEEPGDEQ